MTWIKFPLWWYPLALGLLVFHYYFAGLPGVANFFLGTVFTYLALHVAFRLGKPKVIAWYKKLTIALGILWFGSGIYYIIS